IATAGTRSVVVLAHHPIYSGGAHGEHWSLGDYIGSGPVILLRRMVNSAQDFRSNVNTTMRQAISSAFDPLPPLLYISGHDHALQVLTGQPSAHEPLRYIVSGAGDYLHLDPVRRVDRTRWDAHESGLYRNSTVTKRTFWLLAGSLLVSSASVRGQAPGEKGALPKSTNRGPSELRAPGHVVPAPPPPTSDVPEWVTVVPGADYHAPFWRKWFAGAHYRDLWVTPIRVQVLDLARFAGGLTPIEHGGGEQTVSLHMMGANGIEYALRSVNKRPKVPEQFEGTVIEQLVADETSAGNPAAPLIVAPLEHDAHVLHEEPAYYVIPDDPRLGKFQHEFAGMLAEVEGRPKTKDGEEGFGDASKVVKTDKLMEQLNSKAASNRVDEHAYLTARLTDLYVGDWDRGPEQWRWARFGDKGERLWEPIPVDRDWAFVRSDGLIAYFARPHRPELVVFNSDYPTLFGLMFQQWDQDRRLLQDLERPAFDSTARWLQSVWTDSAIKDAVAHMPPPMQAKRGEFMVRSLERRRDKLPREADAYYRAMAWGADVHTSTEPAVVEITRSRDTVDLRIRAKDAEPVDPYFERQFVNGETHEIRVYLDGGPDSVVERGGNDGIKIRILAGANG